MSTSSRKVADLTIVISILSGTCFVPLWCGDLTIHVDEHLATWDSALEHCRARGERLVSPQNLSDKDKDILLGKLEKDVKFWTMPVNTSQVVVWSGCVEEKSPKALSQLEIPITYVEKQSSLPKCLGYCLKRDNIAAVGLKADGICWCFSISDLKEVTSAIHCGRNCSETGMDECGKKLISLYSLVPEGAVLTAEEQLLGTGKCVYFVYGAKKHFDICSCDKTMPGFVCEEHYGSAHVYNRSATWQEANRACQENKMLLCSSYNPSQSITTSFLWMGFFVSPTPIISPNYNAEGSNCPIISRTGEGHLKLEKDNCEYSHRYLCIQDEKNILHSGSSDQASKIGGAVAGSFILIILIAAVTVVIYRRRANRRDLNKPVFDNRMYQEVMETDPSGCHNAARSELNLVSNIPSQARGGSDIYTVYAEITESSLLEAANPGPAPANSRSTTSQGFDKGCLHYASCNITKRTGDIKSSTITEHFGPCHTSVAGATTPIADSDSQMKNEYETIF